MRISVLTAIVALCGCAVPPRVAPPAARPTIVSLNPCADAILAEVAAPGQLLAVSHYSHDPRVASMPVARARRFAATGGTVEEIVALRPDRVIGDPFTPPATRGALARLRIAFTALPIASTVAQSEAQVRALARIAGRPAAGEALVARIERGLAAAAPRDPRPISTIVWQGGGLVAGDGALIAELLRRTGHANAAAARGLGQGAVLPLEAMIAAPPRLILSAGGDADRTLSHPALGALRGTARDTLDPRLLFCGGPTIPRTAARLARIRAKLDKPLPFRGGVGVGSVPPREVGSSGQAPPAAPPLNRRGG